VRHFAEAREGLCAETDGAFAAAERPLVADLTSLADQVSVTAMKNLDGKEVKDAPPGAAALNAPIVEHEGRGVFELHFPALATAEDQRVGVESQVEFPRDAPHACSQGPGTGYRRGGVEQTSRSIADTRGG